MTHLKYKKKFARGRIRTHDLQINFKRFVYIPNFQLQLLIPFVNIPATTQNCYSLLCIVCAALLPSWSPFPFAHFLPFYHQHLQPHGLCYNKVILNHQQVFYSHLRLYHLVLNLIQANMAPFRGELGIRGFDNPWSIKEADAADNDEQHLQSYLKRLKMMFLIFSGQKYPVNGTLEQNKGGLGFFQYFFSALSYIKKCNWTFCPWSNLSPEWTSNCITVPPKVL